MRILLISAYEASSHKAWAHTLMSGLSEHQWQYLALPARHFAWRIRGNALSFAMDADYRPLLDAQYDLVVATSMTDCAGLKALCPNLQTIPWLLYFHENQFAYPANDKQQGLVEMQMVTLYSAMAADKCVFNSHFNQQSFFDGARALLKKLPDYSSPNWLQAVEERSCVLPVPIVVAKDLDKPVKRYDSSESIKLVWNARWEFDKGPDRLLAILKELESRRLDFQIAVLGEQFREEPKAFAEIKQRYSHRIEHFGYVPSREQYLNYLANAHVVLSTALHEFLGLAVLEAVSLGCIPLLPNRQVYPELFAKDYLYDSVIDDVEQEAISAVDTLLALLENPQSLPSCQSFSCETLLPSYQALFEQLAKPN